MTADQVPTLTVVVDLTLSLEERLRGAYVVFPLLTEVDAFDHTVNRVVADVGM